MKLLKSAFILLSFLVSITACAADGKSENAKQKEKTGMKTVHLTKSEFISKVFDYNSNPKEWKYKGDKPAIVDFYATWCGPCKVLSPILEELAQEYQGQINIYKIDVDKERELASAFNIQSIPTLMFVSGKGQPVITQGLSPKAELKRMIDEQLLGGAK